MLTKKCFSVLFSLTLIVGLLSPTVVRASSIDQPGQKSISTVEEQDFNQEVFVAKPLVILMDYPDYNHVQLEEKEDWTINGFKGSHFTKEFYEKMFFGDETYTGSDGREFITMNKFFKESSGGSYAVKGGVTDWYQADHNAVYYGANTDDSDQDDATRLVIEAIEKAAADPTVDLSEYDVEDKWDKDGDGNYYEPDGIIDTLIVVHAGKGEEWDNSLGEDAIWPFRAGFSWYDVTNFQKYEVTDSNGDKWLAEDFTIFEQDLPLDLLSHEYGHVLGLPDLYSTSEGKPPVEYWSLMGGSYTGKIPGTFPNDFGAYCKELLQEKFEKIAAQDNDHNYEANWQDKVTYDLDDIESNGIDVVLDQTSIKGSNKDCIRINLPEKQRIVTTPVSGAYAYFSGKGNNLKNYMSTDLNLQTSNDVKLTFKTWYDIDPGFDFCSIQVKEKGTDQWIAVEGNITTTEVDDWVKDNETEEQIKERNPGHGITYDSGEQWVDAEFNLNQYSGKEIELRFRWFTDSNTPEEGIYIDDIKVIADGNELLYDDADGETVFTLDGFEKNDGIVTSQHYYLLEWRNNTGEIDKLYTSWSETAVYDPGLVMWYIDDMWIDYLGRPDQNTQAHPGHCFAGIVDAGQKPVVYEYFSGTREGETGIDRMSYQMYDATFSLRENSGFNILGDTWKVYDSDMTPKPLFDDSKNYRSLDAIPEGGLILPEYGLKVFVTEESKDRSSAKIHIMRTDGSSASYSQEGNVKVNNIAINDNKIVVEASGDGVVLSEKAYIGYTMENSKGEKIDTSLALTLEDGKYQGDIIWFNDCPSGLWIPSHIIIEDSQGNAKAFFNSDIYSGYGINLSEGKVDTSTRKPIEITDIKTLDRYGNQKDIFNMENAVNVETTIEINTLEQDTIDEALVIIEVKDQSDSPYAIRYVPIVEGLDTYSQGFTLYNVERGTHTVTVLIWDNLTNKNPLSEVKTFNFTVE